jgi:LacI family transcriptional regulator
MPFVLIDRYIPSLETDYVVFDNYGGAYDATRHLIELGHKRIGHLTHSLSITTTVARVRGYKDALAGAGIHSSPDLVRYGTDPASCTVAITDLLSQGVTALLCGNSHHLLVAYDILTKEMNLKIPEDISLAGFAAPRDVDHMSSPFMVVSHPSYEMGRRAAEVLLTKIYGDDTEVKRIVLKTELIAGGLGSQLNAKRL